MWETDPRAHRGLKRVREGPGRATCRAPGVSLDPEPPAGYLKLERPVATLCIVLPQNHHPTQQPCKTLHSLPKVPPHSTHCLQGSPRSVYTTTLRARKPCPPVSQRRKLRHGGLSPAQTTP